VEQGILGKIGIKKGYFYQLDKNLRRKTMVLEACKQVDFMTTATLQS